MQLTARAQELAAEVLAEGAIALDATAGNGNDTLFLAQHVGSSGSVYAIDVQSIAIDRTRAKVTEAGLADRVQLAQANHRDLEHVVAPKHRGRIACAMFNLGYLPSSDKSVVTLVESTMAGIQAAAGMLRPDGLLSILAYVGHPGGRAEADAIHTWLEGQAQSWLVIEIRDESNPNSPVLWSARRAMLLDAI